MAGTYLQSETAIAVEDKKNSTIAYHSFFEITAHGLKCECLKSSERRPKAQVKFDSCSDCIDLPVIEVDWIERSRQDMTQVQINYMLFEGLYIDIRSFGIAKLCSFHLKPAVTLQSCLSNLCTDVFSFSITVGPYEKGLRVTSLLLDILCNGFLILKPYKVRQPL